MNNSNTNISPGKLSSNNRGTKQKAYIALTITSFIWGTTWVASKISVQQVPGLQVSYLRQFAAGSMLIIFHLIRGEKLPTAKQFGWLATLSVFIFVLANGFSTWSVKYMSSGLASLIGALYPLCVAMIEMFILKSKHNSPLTFTGLVIGIGGVAIVFYENAFHTQPDGYSFGVMLGFIAMLSWSTGTILITRNKYKMNPYYAIGWQMFIGSFIIFLLAHATNNTIPLNEVPAKTWAVIAYLIIMGSIVAFAAFIYSIKYLPAAQASLYAYINPLVAMLTGALLLGEPLALNLITGAVITLAGVYLVNYSMKKG